MIKSFTVGDLNNLSNVAANSPRYRQHLNLHVNYDEPCQRLFNAIEPNSYIRPHCHGREQGVETVFAIRGLMALICFNNKGEVDLVKFFGESIYTKTPSFTVGMEIPPGIWHTVVSLVTGSVLLEIKRGPFDPSAPKIPAPWAPEEGCLMASEYFGKLRKTVFQLCDLKFCIGQ